MRKEDYIEYWLKSSENDYSTMMNLLNSKDYHWALFIGHLVIEKIIKAIYIQNNKENIPPRIHNLLLLSEKAKLKVDDSQEDLLDLITTFNISTRYPDYKGEFYRKCNESFATKNIEKIKELRSWLLQKIKK
jgi:HEPN domain-containing protein